MIYKLYLNKTILKFESSEDTQTHREREKKTYPLLFANTTLRKTRLAGKVFKRHNLENRTVS